MFELEADGVWRKSLVEALREYGVAISRDGENELTGLLAAQALAWLINRRASGRSSAPEW